MTRPRRGGSATLPHLAGAKLGERLFKKRKEHRKGRFEARTCQLPNAQNFFFYESEGVEKLVPGGEGRQKKQTGYGGKR